MKKFSILLVFIFLLTSCSGRMDYTPKGKILVTASFYPVYFLAQEIGWEKANVVNMTPTGVEPHDFEPSVQDRLRIENSRLFVINWNVESWWEKMLPDLERKGIVTVSAGSGVMTLSTEEEGKMEKDPHVWLSPKKIKILAEHILEWYLKADPNNVWIYKENAKNLERKLDALEQTYNMKLAHCARKDFITSHAAFGYIASDYHLNQIALSGISPETEPTARAIRDTVDIIRKKHIPIVFTETLASPRLSETIARETGARTLVLNPLEGLTSSETEKWEDYFSVMKKNLLALSEALSCQ